MEAYKIGKRKGTLMSRNKLHRSQKGIGPTSCTSGLDLQSNRHSQAESHRVIVESARESRNNVSLVPAGYEKRERPSPVSLSRCSRHINLASNIEDSCTFSSTRQGATRAEDRHLLPHCLSASACKQKKVAQTPRHFIVANNHQAFYRATIKSGKGASHYRSR